MLSRALSLAAVTLLIGCLTAGVVRAENLDAGKSPAQIFSSTCSACHRSPRGLLKNTPASSLPGFLRQHYTSGSQTAAILAAYLRGIQPPAERAARPKPKAKPAGAKPKAAEDAKPASECKPADMKVSEPKAKPSKKKASEKKDQPADKKE